MSLANTPLSSIRFLESQYNGGQIECTSESSDVEPTRELNVRDKDKRSAYFRATLPKNFATSYDISLCEFEIEKLSAIPLYSGSNCTLFHALVK